MLAREHAPASAGKLVYNSVLARLEKQAKVSSVQPDSNIHGLFIAEQCYRDKFGSRKHFYKPTNHVGQLDLRANFEHREGFTVPDRADPVVYDAFIAQHRMGTHLL